MPFLLPFLYNFVFLENLNFLFDITNLLSWLSLILFVKLFGAYFIFTFRNDCYIIEPIVAVIVLATLLKARGSHVQMIIERSQSLTLFIALILFQRFVYAFSPLV